MTARITVQPSGVLEDIASSKPRRAAVRMLRGLLLAASVLVSALVQAAGTEAGRTVTNRAEIRYQIGGSGELTDSSEIATPVDELLDVSVVLADSAAVAVTAPQSAAVLEFQVTNIGNGTESFRLVAEDALAGDDFDPALATIYLESNSLPGLQIGPGGDIEYVAGANDPVLLADALVAVYVTGNIPSGPVQNDLGNLRLRAVADTIVTQTGTDDPSQAAFPGPGVAFAGAGDPAQAGGNVTAVVGTAHDPANLLLRATGTFEVSAALVAVSKTVLSVLDPDGGSEVVTGALVTYQIAVTITGAGTVAALQINDPLPALIDYVPGTLTVDNLPPGEEIDDDFLPAGADNTGYDPGTRALSTNLGTQAGGGTTIAIEFQAIVL